MRDFLDSGGYGLAVCIALSLLGAIVVVGMALGRLIGL